MRNMIGAVLALALTTACLPALAQQVPSFNLYGPIPAGTNVIGKVGIDQTTQGTTNGVVVNSSALPLGAATAANQLTRIQNPSETTSYGSYAMGYATTPLAYGAAGTGSGYPFYLDSGLNLRTAISGGVWVTNAPGGLTTVGRTVSSAASVNPNYFKASAGRVYKITGYNATTSVRWLKFFNKASSPIVGTDTVYFSLPMPPGYFSFDAQDIGYYFSTGIAMAMTVGAADNDGTALAAGDILNLNVWVQ